jgi:phage terminase large subunit-like protein
MRNKGLTARPAARKGTGSRTKKTVAVASRKSQPIIQMVERSAAGSRTAAEVVKKTGELPIPSSTFVF